MIARHPADLGTLIGDPRWDRLQQRSGAPLWTDNASNVWQVLKWRYSR